MSRKDAINSLYLKKPTPAPGDAEKLSERVRTGAISAMGTSLKQMTDGAKLATRLQEQLGLSIVIVAHDLAIVREVCSDVTVMYLGRVAEEGRAKPLFADPAHPYSQALLSAVPSPDPSIEKTRPRILLVGEIRRPAAGSPAAARLRNPHAAPRSPPCARSAMVAAPRVGSRMRRVIR